MILILYIKVMHICCAVLQRLITRHCRRQRPHLLLTSLLSASSSIELTDLVRSNPVLAPSVFWSCLVLQYCSHCRRFHLGAFSRPSPAAIAACITHQSCLAVAAQHGMHRPQSVRQCRVQLPRTITRAETSGICYSAWLHQSLFAYSASCCEFSAPALRSQSGAFWL